MICLCIHAFVAHLHYYQEAESGDQATAQRLESQNSLQRQVETAFRVGPEHHFEGSWAKSSPQDIGFQHEITA